VGYELRRQLREELGPQVTGLQRAVALEIADDANEKTRESWASLEDLARWTAARDVNVVRTTLKRLAAVGWEFRVPLGVGKDGRVLFAVPGRRLTFKVPPFEGVTVVTPKGEPAVPLGPEGVTTVPTEGTTVPSEGTPVTPFSSLPSDPSTDKDSSPTAARQPKKPTPKVNHHLEAFGAFWLVYPKKRAREEAKKAWCAAIERGADPERIVTSATVYARERASEDPKFTKYPATWLNKGCYDDEPDPATGGRPTLRAIPGSWQPYTNPTDHSVYKNGWGN
jgi:hypothetical protein